MYFGYLVVLMAIVDCIKPTYMYLLFDIAIKYYHNLYSVLFLLLLLFGVDDRIK